MFSVNCISLVPADMTQSKRQAMSTVPQTLAGAEVPCLALFPLRPRVQLLGGLLVYVLRSRVKTFNAPYSNLNTWKGNEVMKIGSGKSRLPVNDNPIPTCSPKPVMWMPLLELIALGFLIVNREIKALSW